jgi:hypothetical protein
MKLVRRHSYYQGKRAALKTSNIIYFAYSSCPTLLHLKLVHELLEVKISIKCQYNLHTSDFPEELFQGVSKLECFAIKQRPTHKHKHNQQS